MEDDIQNINKENEVEKATQSGAEGKDAADGTDAGGFFQKKYTEYMSEFRKIVWPSRNDLLKQTLTVIVISLVFGVYVAALDGVFSTLFQQIVQIFH